MAYSSKKLLLAAVFSSAFLLSGLTQAAVYEKTVITTPEVRPGINYIDFNRMDRNHDGILSRSEVGAELFYLFDRDGNEIIDNVEFDRVGVYTLTPLQKETVFKIDFDEDGMADVTEYNVENFLDRTRLSRFDTDNNGLSPREFIRSSFLKLDDNDSKAIELDEWEKAYTASILPKAAEQDRYNN